MTIPAVHDARPPLALVRMLNPILRIVLRTPLGWLVHPFALLEFDGRRSGKRFRVPVGWHEVDGGHVVISPAVWRANFRPGLPAMVWYRARRHHLTGHLDDDPERVARILRSLVDRDGSLRRVGIDLPPDHEITGADVIADNRAAVLFPRA